MTGGKKNYLTLTKNGEFHRAYARGVSRRDPALVTYAVKNRRGCVRLGITTGKKIGNSVCRSRCRRVIRAAFMSLGGRVRSGYDYVFVARTLTCEKKSTEIQKIMAAHLEKLGLLLPREGGENA